MSGFYPCATELALKYHMNRIRAWIVRLLQGEAKSTPPGNGQLRESWDEREGMREA